MPGGYGCDMGELPAPPAAFGWILLVLGIVAFIVGLHMLLTGTVLLRIGTLKNISTAPGARLFGLALVLDSIVSAWLAYQFKYFSQHQLPPTWAQLIFVPLFLVAALQWLAFRIDRRRKAP